MVSGRPSLRRRILHGAAIVGVLGTTLLAATPAQATTADDGQWWYQAYGVEQVHADGLTGEGVKIAVIDSQINPDLPVFDGADLTIAPGAGCMDTEPATDELNDNSRHGSTVTALLIGNGTGAGAINGIVPDASVTFYGFGNRGDDCVEPPEATAAGLSPAGWLFQRALDDGADIISTSQGGGASYYDDLPVIAEAIARQVPIVAATPNDGLTGAILPSGYSGVVAVNAVDQQQQLLIGGLGVENTILETTVVAPGSPFSSIGAPDGTWDDSNRTQGSSLATPLVAGILALAAEKYPDATKNQLIQSLIHNTGPEDHDLTYSPDNGFGYGVASLGHVLRVDPSSYEDVNPLLDKSLQQPTPEQIATAMAALSEDDTSPAASDQPTGDTGDQTDSGIATVLVVGGIVVGIVVIGAVILTIILVRRSHRTDREGQS
jgi:hypothetical protein